MQVEQLSRCDGEANAKSTPDEPQRESFNALLTGPSGLDWSLSMSC